MGTDLLREPLDVRLGIDDEDGGGLGDRDFICCCALCVSERSAACCDVDGNTTQDTAGSFWTISMQTKGQLLLMSSRERVCRLRAWLSGGAVKDDYLDGGDDEEEEGTEEQKRALGPQNPTSPIGMALPAPAMAPSVQVIASKSTDANASPASSRKQLRNKDQLEMSVQLAISLLECERAEEALQLIQQVQRRAFTEWLPEMTRDELQSSFAVYALVAAAALVIWSSSQTARTSPVERLAREAVIETEAVFGSRAARAIIQQGSPSALKREIDAVCSKLHNGTCLHSVCVYLDIPTASPIRNPVLTL